jgi:alpha-1,3-rhamnosyl/mannosyltransferase
MTGIGHFALYVLELLHDLSAEWLITVLVSPGYDRFWEAPEGVAVVLVNSPDPLWEQLQLPALLDRLSVDIYVTPLFELPRVKVGWMAATIHDMIPLSAPELSSDSFTDYFKRHVPVTVDLADVLLTVSEFSAAEVRRFFPAAEDRVRVFPQGTTDTFRKGLAQSRGPLLRKYRLRSPFLFCAGPIERRKGIDVLLRAFSAFKREGPEELSLVITGAAQEGGVDVLSMTQELGITDSVRTPGHVPEEDLAGLLSASEALVFPSLCEGFGRPVLEAFAAGVPVVASDIPPVREVAGGACVLVDPGSVESLKDGLAALLCDPARRDRCVAMGRERVKHFSRERSVQAFSTILDELIHHS